MTVHISPLHIGEKPMNTQTLTLAEIQPQPSSVSKTKVKLLEALNLLVTTLTLPGSIDDMLQALATLTMESTDIDLCTILLKGKASNHLNVHASAPTLSHKNIIIEPITIDPTLWERLHGCVARNQLPHLNEHELAMLSPLKNVQYKTLLPIPLIAGSEVIGMINCYASGVLRCNPGEQLILLAIANQAALAIKHRLYIAEDALIQKTRLNAFIDELLFTTTTTEETLYRRAQMLGYELAEPHAVALAELTEIVDYHVQSGQNNFITPEERLLQQESILEHFKQSLQEHLPGILVAQREHQLICLLSMHTPTILDQFNHCISSTMQHTGQNSHMQIAAGISNTCQTIGEYRRGYSEAQEALGPGQLLRKNQCTPFNELGAYRYIFTFARTDTLRDQFQDQVTSIVEYDQRKKANLLETLEMYLECGGNMAKTSSQLAIHRNTLLQRIDRLHKLCVIDLELVSNRLPLLVAIKVHKLRAHYPASGSG